jgi:cytidylate kinase
MAIITISRELAALGDETAQELARRMGCRFVDKQSLDARIKSYGISGRKFQKYDERKPGLWASLSQDRDEYFHYLKTAMLAEAGEGSAIFIGRGANAVFRGVPGVLSVFLAAPFEIRAERVKSYFHCDEKRARQIIEQSDRDREGFHRNFFNIEWKEPSNYHLTVNTGHLHPAVSAELILHLQEQMIDGEAEEQNARRLKEMSVGQQVAHRILYEKAVSIHFLEAVVSGNTVSLFGAANSQALVEAAVCAAREAAPGFEIRPEIQVVRDYGIVP